MTLAAAAASCRGRLRGGPGGLVLTSYHTDSREVRAGGLFFALPGAQGDGHDFLLAAAERGAAAAVVNRPLAVDLPQIVVADTWRALYDLAGSTLASIAPLVIGITGSSGKTSTKELTAAALEGNFRVRKTVGNLNTETGVPLTLLQLEPGEQALVLEMGMRGAGEIARLARLARPQIGVITNVGSAHAEYFPDGIEGIRAAKSELVEALPPEGLAVLNADDPSFEHLRLRTQARVTSFGFEAGDLRAHGYRPTELGCAFEVGGLQVQLSLAGRHQAGNALAALAVARDLGISLGEAAPRLLGVSSQHRLQSLGTAFGWTLIDDSYNANPESMMAAFEVMAELSTDGRRLALLGEMRELGGLARAAHERIGRRAAELFDEVAVMDVGMGSVLAEAAGATLLSGEQAALDWVHEHMTSADVLLVKASNGVGLHALIERLRT
ncbi:MAG TPA: UDP-N-acetylmuramoyl-tripeptide--D-alanyl-D-alanine ligase [Candidatus Acidoferrales bacterium]|nr:UDP-N-acetylmuramoyl-tripeptide--D-alanyl-D-alanine ligase [Candidatus Acidoferrales bacterium]